MNKKETKLRPILKKVTTYAEHCPKCNNRLVGNGSQFSPYACECGMWEYVYYLDEWHIIPYPDNAKKNT